MKRCLGCMQTYNNELNICPHCGYAENTTPDEAIHMVPGTILQDRFIIGKVVGCGGFGVTYVAWDKVLEHKVAIKEYLPSEFSTRMPGASRLTIYEGDKTIQFDDGMDRFLDEARRLAKFQNESGIVKILDCFEENRTAYIVMEYLQGITLTQYLEKYGKISEDEAVNMILPILNSLKSVHREGIIHRDIAPDNIMVTDDGQVKLIDFGAARYATTSHSRSLTVIIKQGYSPVEQYQSRGNQGAYTDVYAIGAVLYRMITGITPPDSMERNAYYENSRKDILDPMHKCVKGVSENRENAILNAMNIRIEDRSPDMDTLIKELTTDEPVARVNGKIKRKDILQWPLWLKITIPMAMMGVIALFVLLITGVIGFEFKKPREIAIPEGMTRVPRIVSMDEESAKNKLAEKKLNYIVTGAEYDSLIAEGCVLTQAMEVGSLVPVNSNLEVIISAGAECYDVPYLVGINKDEAVELLEINFFEYEIVEEYNSVIASDCVISQSVSGGTELEKGSVINITISKGRDPEKTYSFDGELMPDLSGKTLEEAQTICESYGILLKVTDYEYNDELATSCVIYQSVEADETISADTVVELVLSKGKRIFKVPSVTYLPKDSATSKLLDRGFFCSVQYEFSENVLEGYVISQSISAGEIIEPNTVIILTVSKGLPRFDMIDVSGMPEGDAIKALQELGLVVTVSYGFDVEVEFGAVISQSVTHYEKVYKGCEVELVICSDEFLLEVPNVVNYSYDSAVRILKEAGFNVEENPIIEYTSYIDEDNHKSWIKEQNPSAGSIQKAGTTVVISFPMYQYRDPNILIEPYTIPKGCTYYKYATGEVLYENEILYEKPKVNDQLRTNDYIYHCCEEFWCVETIDKTKTKYEEFIPIIAGIPLARLEYYTDNYDDSWGGTVNGTFENCVNLVVSPKIPDGVTGMCCTFRGCTSLKETPEIPDSVGDLSGTFESCTNLFKVTNIPKEVNYLSFTFSFCYKLTGEITINGNPSRYEDCFQGVDFTAQNLTLSGTSTMLDELRATGDN